MYLSNKYHETFKGKKYYPQVLKDTGHTWGHTVRVWAERETRTDTQEEKGIGVLPLLGPRVEYLGFSRLSLSI